MTERGPFGNIIARVQAFKSNVDEIIIQEARDGEAELIDLNTDEQLAQGYGSDGQAIRPPYTYLTKLIKGTKGQESEFVTLHDTGDFYSGFDIAFGKTSLEFGSNDSKTKELVEKYGERIFGLDKDNLQFFIDDFLRGKVVNRFRKEIFT